MSISLWDSRISSGHFVQNIDELWADTKKIGDSVKEKDLIMVDLISDTWDMAQGRFVDDLSEGNPLNFFVSSMKGNKILINRCNFGWRMKALVHLIAGILFALVLNQLLVLDIISFFVIVIWSILIDIDHLFFYYVKYRKNSVKSMYELAKTDRHMMRANLYIFHSPEFNIIILLFSLYNFFFRLILLTSVLHLLLDIIEHYSYEKSFGWIRRWSIIYSLLDL